MLTDSSPLGTKTFASRPWWSCSARATPRLDEGSVMPGYGISGSVTTISVAAGAAFG